MGKRRKGGNSMKKERSSFKTKRPREDDQDNHPSLSLDPTDRSFIYDKIDDFEDEKEMVSLHQAKEMMERRPVAREQVLGLGGGVSSSDDDDDDDEEDDDDDNDESGSDSDKAFMDDDIMDEQEDKMPDERAWGGRKSVYYNTDMSDEKIQWKVYNQDEDEAQLEADTARKLQERMAAELKDLVPDDLILQTEDKEDKEDIAEDFLESDMSSLSRSRKLQLLKRESPEFLPLIDDLKNKCEEMRCILSPLMEAVNKGKVPEGPVHQYITTKYRLVLNYISTISMYIMVKCSSKNVAGHPVLSRLAQYRQLLKELETCDNKLASHLGKLLDDITEDQETVKEKPRKRKKLRLLNKNKVAKVDEKEKLMSLLKEPVQKQIQKMTKDRQEPGRKKKPNIMEASSDEEQIQEFEKEEVKTELEADEKRPLGYLIQKNKGLLPHRRKDQRNPRVKYKNKYQKKLKRRKGQVPGVRRELKRYDGEMTGIRSHLIKSIKIKS